MDSVRRQASSENRIISSAPLWALPAFRVVAARALVAALDPDQRCLAAFWALRQASREGSLVRDQRIAGSDFLLADCSSLTACRQKADRDHVALDDVADRGQQRGHVLAVHPGAAARVEHRL